MTEHLAAPTGTAPTDHPAATPVAPASSPDAVAAPDAAGATAPRADHRPGADQPAEGHPVGEPRTADHRAPAGARHSEWWREAVIYQVYPRSFADADGDGMGDLAGVRHRLPHLRDLGVDAVWLSPCYASPQADAGYDVADYRAIDPMFGTLADAEAVIDEAHRLGLRVIVDLVPNHCSDQHAWFRRALREGPGSAPRDRFHFRAGKGADGQLPPNDWESIFGGPAWTRTTNPDGTPGEWYLHLFAPQQPDFNWDHPAVQDEFRTILRFWLDLGVDGFRIDVAHGLVKAAGLPDMGRTGQLKLLGNQALPFFDQDGVHAIYRSWRKVLDEYPGQRVGVAEAWTPSAERTARYLRPDELHQAFNFHYLTTGWDAAALRAVIDESLAAMRPVGAPTTWVLSNHDVVRHATRFADAGPEQGLARARAAALLMLALPGSAYLYQGEELGLPEVTDLPDEVRQDPSFFRGDGQAGLRDGCRVPLPWSGDVPPYGFGPEPGGPSWLPQPATWARLSVAAQTGDPHSTLELYRRALAVRREQPALGAGDAVRWLTAPEGVLSFRRDAPLGGVQCTVNTTSAPVRLPEPGPVLVASAELGPAEGGTRELPADTAVWWAV
ncbi:glycoside hydrolase family 13 protein [Streptomyces sp. 71268]|uniref:glycoside hydrolase family 13 protein n=1 Tax=Streptomyces sp. 71268 TaxID=3002640 RepID=UPI0023F80A94|nr:glycoside hydrolase family 13 protein [Streptomyces sp. 71268]WEV28180.1 glycoside hydrolase family 13 protein [Streptomyces sp. 71268]